MIPSSYLQAWSAKAPWPDLRQVEQDLVISRALCDLFGSSELQGRLAFRGGTAIHKLLFDSPLRYSEDIDLVQVEAGPVGRDVDAVRKALAWLGEPRRDQAAHSMHLTYRFAPEADAASTMKLKVEINTREHGSLHGLRRYPFEVESDWFRGDVEIQSYVAEELFGTKLRALLQRRKNRDLFDLLHGLDVLPVEPAKVIASLDHYLSLEGTAISRAEAEQRMLEKLDRSLIEDVVPLLPVGVRFEEADALRGFERVWRELIQKMSGQPWKSTDRIVEQLRTTRFPTLLT